MSNFSGKKFFFTGEFTFFSKQQRDDALNFHGACLSNTISDRADFIVIGNEFDQAILDQQTSETVYSEWDFTKYVIRPTYSEEKSDSEAQSDNENSVSVAVDIRTLISIISELENGKIYTCLFTYPRVENESPIIRCLFSYIKDGKQVLFACRGLTDESSGYPLSQYGMLSIAKNVTAAAFESFEDQPITDELYFASADDLNGTGFYELTEADKPLKLSKKAIAALDKLDAFQEQCYFIDDSDYGYYRVTPSFYSQHHEELESNDSYADEDFSEIIYYAAESVLTTGEGWLF